MDFRTWIPVSLALCFHLTYTSANFNIGCPDFCICNDNYVTCKDFKSLDLTFLPPEADTLIMSEGELEEMPPAFFARAHMLKTVQISKVDVRVVRGGAFMGLKNLEVLSFLMSSFDIVEPDGFSGVHHIEQFQISECHFGRVAKHAFAEITNVEVWQIYSSYFASISDEAFYGLRDIHTIQIYQNNITYIGFNIFAGSENLDYINFYMNHIQTLSEGSLTDGIKATERFIVYANKFECSCDIAWTQEDESFNLYLSSNECTFPGGADPSQSTFRLSDLRRNVLCPDTTTTSTTTEPSTFQPFVHTMAPFVVEEMGTWPDVDAATKIDDEEISLPEGNVSEQNTTMHENKTTSVDGSSEVSTSIQSNSSSSSGIPSSYISSPSPKPSSVESSTATGVEQTTYTSSEQFPMNEPTSLTSSDIESTSSDQTSTSKSLEVSDTPKQNSVFSTSKSMEITVDNLNEFSSPSSALHHVLLSSSFPSLSSSSSSSSSTPSTFSSLSSTSFSSPTLPAVPIPTSKPLRPSDRRMATDSNSTSTTISSDESLDLSPSVEISPESTDVSSRNSESSSSESRPSSMDPNPSPTSSSLSNSALVSKIMASVSPLSESNDSSRDSTIVSTSFPPVISTAKSSSFSSEGRLEDSSSDSEQSSRIMKTSTKQSTKSDLPQSHTQGYDVDGDMEASNEILLRDEMATARLAPVIGEKQEQRQEISKPDSTSAMKVDNTTKPDNSGHIIKTNHCFLVVCLLLIRFLISQLFTG